MKSKHILVIYIYVYSTIFYKTTYYFRLSTQGRKVAIDASMSIYQFLIAVRTEGASLTNESGETTRLLYHIMLVNIVM